MDHTISILQLQKIYLEMLQEFHAFCVEQNLTYYLVGGTLLGAVREKGFIPWDDDVDIAMPRPDYERFIRTYSGGMILQTIHDRTTTCFPYVKMFHGSTPVMRLEDEQFGVHGDVMVQFDLYPVDGIGNDYHKAQKYAKTISFYKWLLFLNQSTQYSKNPVKRILVALLRCIPAASMVKFIDRKMRKYSVEDSAYLTRWREGVPNRNIVPAAVFGKPVLLPFENLQLYAPQDCHAYLTNVYGSYMEPKRENEGLRHDVSLTAQTARMADELKNN